MMPITDADDEAANAAQRAAFHRIRGSVPTSKRQRRPPVVGRRPGLHSCPPRQLSVAIRRFSLTALALELAEC